MSLFDFLFPLREDEGTLRGISDDEFCVLTTPNIMPATRPGTVSLLPFSNPHVRAAVHEAKYHGNERAFRLLANVLADYLRDADDLPRDATIIPVPLGRIRRKKRGFNQVEEVATRAVREIDLVVDTALLARVRETETQVSRTREEREENLRGAFGATHPADPALTYVLLDDVITTGATLQAAISALRTAGAVHIVPVAIAHTH